MIGAGDNRLAVLAAEIREADGRFKRATLEAAVTAIEIGNLLIEAKSLVKHGQWLPWLRDHAAIGERSAQLYMRLARSGLNPQSVADLGIHATDDALAKHGVPADEDAAPAEPYDYGIPINDVIFVRDCYPRDTFDLEYVQDLAERLDELPPIEINQNNELIDGRYRWEAHKARGMKRIRVVVTETQDQLHHVKLAVSRNSGPPNKYNIYGHGQPLTREERRDIIQRLAELKNKPD